MFVLQSLTISLNHSIKFFVCLVSVLNLFPSDAFQSVNFYFNLQLCTETLRNTEYMSGFLKDTIRVQFLTKCRLRNKKNIFVSYFRLSFFPILTISAFYFSNCQFIWLFEWLHFCLFFPNFSVTSMVFFSLLFLNHFSWVWLWLFFLKITYGL